MGVIPNMPNVNGITKIDKKLGINSKISKIIYTYREYLSRSDDNCDDDCLDNFTNNADLQNIIRKTLDYSKICSDILNSAEITNLNLYMQNRVYLETKTSFESINEEICALKNISYFIIAYY